MSGESKLHEGRSVKQRVDWKMICHRHVIWSERILVVMQMRQSHWTCEKGCQRAAKGMESQKESPPKKLGGAARHGRRPFVN
jgi:hypothetical protein